MGVKFIFYGLTANKKQEYDSLLKSKIEDYELDDWLEENTEIKDAYLAISYSSMSDLTEWLGRYSKSSYIPDADAFYEIDKSDAAREAFLDLYWIKECWIDPYDVWREDVSLIIKKQY